MICHKYTFTTNINGPSFILARLGCVSQGHGMGLCPSSVVHFQNPCRNYLRTYWMDFFQISVVGCLGLRVDIACLKNKLFFWYVFLRYWKCLVSIRPHGNQYFKTRQGLKFFKHFLTFLLNGPHKRTVLNFWNFEFPVLRGFFSGNFTFTILFTTYMDTPKLQLSRKWDIIERSRVRLASGASIHSIHGTFDS